MRKDERRKNMRDTGKITITVAEYKKFLRDEVMLDTITNIAKTSNYITKEVKAMLGIPEKEDEE